MLHPREVINHVFAEPFVPFRVHTASGRVFEVPHPEFVQLGRSHLVVYTTNDNNPEGPHHWEKVSLMLIESLAPLTTPVRPLSS